LAATEAAKWRIEAGRLGRRAYGHRDRNARRRGGGDATCAGWCDANATTQVFWARYRPVGALSGGKRSPLWSADGPSAWVPMAPIDSGRRNAFRPPHQPGVSLNKELGHSCPRQRARKKTGVPDPRKGASLPNTPSPHTAGTASRINVFRSSADCTVTPPVHTLPHVIFSAKAVPVSLAPMPSGRRRGARSTLACAQEKSFPLLAQEPQKSVPSPVETTRAYLIGFGRARPA